MDDSILCSLRLVISGTPIYRFPILAGLINYFTWLKTRMEKEQRAFRLSCLSVCMRC